MATYGKIMTLMGKIDEAIAVLDFACPVPYVFSGGVIYGNFTSANIDLLDLEQPLPSYTWYTESYYGENEKPLIPGIPPINPAIKVCVVNYAWVGYPSVFWRRHAHHHRGGGPCSPLPGCLAEHRVPAWTQRRSGPDLKTAMEHADEIARAEQGNPVRRTRRGHQLQPVSGDRTHVEGSGGEQGGGRGSSAEW